MGVQQGELAVETLKDAEFLDELRPGTPLKNGNFVCRDFLGADGFGITYLASDSSDQVVVIKECFPGAFCRRQDVLVQPRSLGHETEVKSIVRLFLQEAQNLSKLDHPNIVNIRDVFEENNTAYVVMDFVNGRDLLEIVQDDPDQLSPEQIRSYLEKVLDAVSCVHGRGMLHRDISPSNIIVNQNDEPVLIDFGAAREQATKSSRILSVLRVVKNGYSPQEIYLSGSEQGPSCDLYSLAASFYHVITNELPPCSQQRLAASASGRTDPYVPLAEKTKEFDASFCAALDKAMSILPDNRFQSAEGWAEAMRPEAAAVAPAVQLRVEPRRVANRPQEENSNKLVDEIASDEFAEARSSEMVGREPTQGVTDDEGLLADESVRKASSGRVSILRLGAAMVLLAGAALLINPPLLGKNGPIKVMALAPESLQTIALDTEKLPRLASFEPVVRAKAPVPWVAETEAEVPSVFEAAQIAPVLFDSQSQESVEFAALPGPVQTHDLTAELQIMPVAPQATTLDDAASVAALPEVETVIFSTPDVEVTAEAEAPESVMVAAMHPSEIVKPVEAVDTNFQADAPLVPSNETGEVLLTVLPVLPFTADPSVPGLIGAVAEDAPSWIESGLRVVSINGMPIETLDQASAILAGGLSTDVTEIEVSLGVSRRDEQEPIERTLSVPVVREISLSNGLGFQSRFEDGAWITRVTETTGDWEFVEGDVLVGLIRTSQRLDGPDALRQVIEAELAEGRRGFAFAVEREGLMWVETFLMSQL